MEKDEKERDGKEETEGERGKKVLEAGREEKKRGGGGGGDKKHKRKGTKEKLMTHNNVWWTVEEIGRKESFQEEGNSTERGTGGEKTKPEGKKNRRKQRTNDGVKEQKTRQKKDNTKEAKGGERNKG